MKNILTTLVEELNKYDLEAFINAEEVIRFRNFPYLSVSVRETNIEVTSIITSINSKVDATFTQPLQAIRYILGGVWNETK